MYVYMCVCVCVCVCVKGGGQSYDTCMYVSFICCRCFVFLCVIHICICGCVSGVIVCVCIIQSIIHIVGCRVHVCVFSKNHMR